MGRLDGKAASEDGDGIISETLAVDLATYRSGCLRNCMKRRLN